MCCTCGLRWHCAARCFHRVAHCVVRGVIRDYCGFVIVAQQALPLDNVMLTGTVVAIAVVIVAVFLVR